MSLRRLFIIIAVLFFNIGLTSASSDSCYDAFPELVEPSDYTYLWWADCYPAESGKQVYCFQSGIYGFAFDTEKVDFTNFGKFKLKYTSTQASEFNNDLIYDLDRSKLTLTVRADGKTYKCIGQTGIDKKPKYHYVPQRIVSSGKYVQRFDVMYLKFADSRGDLLNADGRFMVIAWPSSRRRFPSRSTALGSRVSA